MASSFNHWQKDPFFAVAEEVQDSADRMESTYRTWIHAKEDSSGMWDSDELRKDLDAAVGTTKWQLEEFGRAVRSSYGNFSSSSSRDRHRDFILAIEDQVNKIEASLQQSKVSDGNSLAWGRLDEGERNEFALFLSAPSTTDEQNAVKGYSKNVASLPPKTVPLRENSDVSPEVASLESKEDKMHRHRRTASASADIGSWKIAISNDVKQWKASNPPPNPPVRKITSFSGFLNSMDSAPQANCSRTGFRKTKATDHRREEKNALLQSSQPTRGIDDCCESGKSCLESGGGACNKQPDGWYGAIHRQLQRSQYQMQYSRPAKVAFWIVLLLCLIVFISSHAM